MGSYFGKVWQCLEMISIAFLRDPAIPLLGIHSKELKTYVHTKTCPSVFTAASFIIAKKWK